jgi:succinate dehydrogenase / fumarate reductase cytochrome b subunit
MSWVSSYLSSSVGKKSIMAFTGLSLVGFILVHLLGNINMLIGADAFNMYAHTLMSMKVIYVAEAILVALFLGHAFFGLKLAFQNSQARPENYAAHTKSGRGTTFASNTMPYTGLIILIFLVMHLFNFKYGAIYTYTVNGEEIRDLYKLMLEYFSKPLNVAWYIVAMISLAIHTSHGVWSAFQSLGFNHPKYNSFLRKSATGYALLVGSGFTFFAVWAYFQNGGNA